MNKLNLEYIVKSLDILSIHPNKNLGQNFLTSELIAHQIVDSLEIKKDEQILEIGCGLGSLSMFIMERSNNATFLDIDPKMIRATKSLKNCKDVHLFLNQNILKTDVSQYDKIVGNLPYYITTELVAYILKNASNMTRFVAMIQKEAYPRLSAKCGQKDYGPLSIFIALLGRIEKVYNVSKKDFFPQPKVDSLVFRINVELSKRINAIKVYRIAKALFLMPRKTILNNLASLMSDKGKAVIILNKLNIPYNKRPQELPIDFYIDITDIVTH